MTSKLVQDTLAQQVDAAATEDDDEFVGSPGEFVREITPHAQLSADLALLQDLVKAREIQKRFGTDRRTRDEPMMKMSREGEVPTGRTYAQHMQAVLPDIEFDIATIVAGVRTQAARLGVRLPIDLENVTRAGTITGTGM